MGNKWDEPQPPQRTTCGVSRHQHVHVLEQVGTVPAPTRQNPQALKKVLQNVLLQGRGTKLVQD